MSTWKQASARACAKLEEPARCIPEARVCARRNRCATASSARRGIRIDASITLRVFAECPMWKPE